MRKKLVPLFALLALAAAACADGEPEATRTPEATSSPTPTGTPLAFSEAATCTNDTYSVPYPADWETNSGDVVGPCTVFHPTEIELEEGTEFGFDWGALLLTEEGVPFTDVVGSEDDPAYRDVSTEETTVAGQRAVIFTATGTGELLLPEGARAYRYVVDLGDERALVAATYDIGDLDFGREKAVLDQMMDGLELRTG